MLKVFAFLTKREGLETRAFIDYYENAAWLEKLSVEEIGVDEERFLNRSRTRAYVIEERS
jgi:hypothetical protein